MIYFTGVKTLLLEFNETYLVSNKIDLSGKIISFMEEHLMFFTDGTYAFIVPDDEEGLYLCNPGDVECNIYWYDRFDDVTDEFWVPFKKFLKQYHPDYLNKFNEINKWDQEEYREAVKSSNFNHALKTLKSLQKDYPNLNITFKNEQN